MKNLILILLLLIFGSSTFAQVGRVTFVKGSVKQAKGRQVRPNDQVNTTEKLTFEKGAAIKFRTREGEFVVDKITILTTIALNDKSKVQAANRINVEGKRGEMLANYTEIMRYFSAGGTKDSPKPMLVIGKGKYPILDTKFRMNESQFFVITYRYKGETINKKLMNEGNTLFLDSTIFTIDSKSIQPEEAKEIKLNFYDTAKGEMTFFTQIKPVFVSEATIKLEIAAIVNTMEGEKATAILEEVLSHLKDSYGEPDVADVKAILVKEHGLKF
jgi:hypothetical protein